MSRLTLLMSFLTEFSAKALKVSLPVYLLIDDVDVSRVNRVSRHHKLTQAGTTQE